MVRRGSSNGTRRHSRSSSSSFPLIFSGFALVNLAIVPGIPETLALSDYESFVTEDTIVEYGQSLSYFLAFILALLIAVGCCRAKRTLHGVLYLVLALGLFFIAGEEISWGQRIFDIALPAYFEERNNQQEITIYNLSGVSDLFDHMYIVVGLYGSLMSVVLPRRIRRDHDYTVELLVPDRILALYFIPAAAFYFYWHYLRLPFYDRFAVGSHHQEPAELLLALGILLFVTINRYRQVVARSPG